MAKKHLACVVALFLLGCGSSDKGGGGGTSGMAYPNCPTCMHSKYVIGPKSATDHGISVPASTTEARNMGCDINGDGSPDNQLGKVLSSIKTIAPSFDVQATVDSSFTHGTLIALFDVEWTPAIDNPTTTGIKGYLGAHDMSDGMTAPQFYMGGGKFTVSMPAGDGFGGTIHSGAGTFGTGPLTVQIPLVDGQPPLPINLTHASVVGTFSQTSITTGKLCGAIPADAIKTQILPAVGDLLSAVVQKGGSTANEITTLFDMQGHCATDANCQSSAPAGNCHCITADELEASDAIKSALAPDLDLDPTKTNPFLGNSPQDMMDPTYPNDALSVGLGFQANTAVFAPQ
jgi:hypothetical protein